MVRFRHHLLLCILLCWAAPTAIMATAFLKPQFAKTVDVQYLHYETHQFWNSDGKKRESFNNFQRNAILMRLEYGLTNTTSLAASTSHNTIDESLNGKTQGFGDIQLSIKQLLTTKRRHLIAGEATAIIPVGGRKTELRYGRWGGQASLIASKKIALANKPAWYDLKIGYRFYQGYPSDQIRSAASLGLCLNKRITLLGTTQLEYGLWNGTKDPENTIRYNSNYRLLKVKGEAFIKIRNRSYLTVGGFGHVWGRNVGTGGGFFTGARVTF